MPISSCQTWTDGGSTIPYTNRRRIVPRIPLRLQASLRTLLTCLAGRGPTPRLRTLSGRIPSTCLRTFSTRSVNRRSNLCINSVTARWFQLLRPEIQSRAPWWAYLGAACGAGLGFIFANIPGLMVGAYAGNRLGAVRDAKGKAVATVFAELGGEQKAEVCIGPVSVVDPRSTTKIRHR